MLLHRIFSWTIIVKGRRELFDISKRPTWICSGQLSGVDSETMTYVDAKMRETLIQLIDIPKLPYDRREPTISQPDQKSSCVLFAVICVVFIKNRFFPDVFRSSSFSSHLTCFHKQRGKLREKLQKGNATLHCSLCKESHIVHRTRKNETPYQSLGIKRLEEVNLGKL